MNNVWSAEMEERAVAAAKNDPREFVDLYDVYADRVYRYFLARLRNVLQAEDLTQQTFLKALEALPRFEWRGRPFGAWLFRIANNCFIDAVSVKSEIALEEIAEPAAPENKLTAEIDAAFAWKKTGLLTEEQRQALALRYRGELAIAEIAALMDKSPAAIKMLLQRAVRMLAASIMEQGTRNKEQK